MTEKLICTGSQHGCAQKICISTECEQPDPFICQDCEQFHEHNGAILAVRLNKVKQICNKIKGDGNKQQKFRDSLGYLKKNINQKIDDALNSLEKGAESQVAVLLQNFVNKEAKGNFASLWERAKSCLDTIKIEDNKNLDLSFIKKQLKDLIDGNQNTEINEPQSSESIKQNNELSQFMQKFCIVFNFLNFQLKSQPSTTILTSLHQLNPSNRTTQLMTCKLYEICNQIDKTVDLYNKILSENPSDFQVLARKSLLFKKKKRYAQAYDELQLLIDISKQKLNVDYYQMILGEICVQLGKYDEGFRLLQKFRQTDSQDTKDRISKIISKAYLQKGNYTQAISEYRKYIKNKQSLSAQEKQQIFEAFNNIAGTDTQTSIKILTFLHELYPQTVEIILKRAHFYHQQKRYQLSAEDYRIAIEKGHKSAGAYYNRSIALIMSGQNQSAIIDLKKAIELDPNFKQAIHLLATTAFELLQKQTNPQVREKLSVLAINSYYYALKFNSENYGILHNLGVLQSQKNPQKSYECFVKAIQVNPKFIPSYLGKVKTSIRLKKDVREILADVNTLIELGDRNYSTFLIKASLLEELKQYNASLQMIQLVLKAVPQNKAAISLKQKLVSVLESSSNSPK